MRASPSRHVWDADTRSIRRDRPAPAGRKHNELHQHCRPAPPPRGKGQPRHRGISGDRTRDRPGTIGSGVYAATKFGISAFSESLRQEVTRQGVRVIVIQPGFVDTELTSHITDLTMQAAAADIAASMRTLRPADIAEGAPIRSP